MGAGRSSRGGRRCQIDGRTRENRGSRAMANTTDFISAVYDELAKFLSVDATSGSLLQMAWPGYSLSPTDFRRSDAPNGPYDPDVGQGGVFAAGEHRAGVQQGALRELRLRGRRPLRDRAQQRDPDGRRPRTPWPPIRSTASSPTRSTNSCRPSAASTTIPTRSTIHAAPRRTIGTTRPPRRDGPRSRSISPT
jgi:hypothetical protein